jgi:hypothetical protein
MKWAHIHFAFELTHISLYNSQKPKLTSPTTEQAQDDKSFNQMLFWRIPHLLQFLISFISSSTLKAA